VRAFKVLLFCLFIFLELIDVPAARATFLLPYADMPVLPAFHACTACGYALLMPRSDRVRVKVLIFDMQNRNTTFSTFFPLSS